VIMSMDLASGAAEPLLMFCLAARRRAPRPSRRKAIRGS
jgi:hypothetical protein